MSQIVTRKGPVGDDKEKRQTDSPVKEMKKKLAANAEKEKQASEKSIEKSQNDKKSEKVIEKPQSDKKLDKAVEKPQSEKRTDKVSEKPQIEKKMDKVIVVVDKSVDKPEKKDKTEKSIDKKDKPEKINDKKEVVADKKESDNKAEKKEKEKVSDKKETQPEKAKEDAVKDKAGKPEADQPRPKPSKENGVNGDTTNGDTVSSDEDEDERDEMFPELAYDDSDGDFEPPTPEGRSYTRRSQSKVLKLKDDTPASDRKLRSSGSPKPEKKDKKESPKKNDSKTILEEPKENELVVDVEVVVENEERVKADTNYSRSRVKVSPYRRLQQPEDCSLLANYTGNNTTMEMDITESSVTSEASPYLSALRSVRGRRSYRHHAGDTPRPASEAPVRPTGTVVGRKRRPDAGAESGADGHKRARLLERLARPFRLAASAEIVGVNTDLPLTVPASSPESFDPETLKCDPPVTPVTPTAPPAERDSKRCVLM